MNTFSTRMSALVLTASLVFAPAFAMEEEVTQIEIEMMFEGFEGEEFVVETPKNEATVWYKKRSTQVAGAVAVAYAVAVCTGKAKAPFALMAAFAKLFCKQTKVENEETKTDENTTSTDVNDAKTSNELVDQSIGGQFTALVNSGKDKLNNSVSNVKAVFAQVSNNWNNTTVDATTLSAQQPN